MVWRSTGVALLGGIAAACNLISGASDLGTCEGSGCEDAQAALLPDPDAVRSGQHLVNPETDAGAAAEPPPATASDGGADAPTCSEVDGACNSPNDCCGVSVCSGAHTCVNACAGANTACSHDSECCVGATCEPFLWYRVCQTH